MPGSESTVLYGLMRLETHYQKNIIISMQYFYIIEEGTS